MLKILNKHCGSFLLTSMTALGFGSGFTRESILRRQQKELNLFLDLITDDRSEDESSDDQGSWQANGIDLSEKSED